MTLTKKIFARFLLVSSMLVNVTLTSCQKDDEAQPDTSIKEVLDAEAIYLHEEYETGVGGYLYVVYNPYLLFNDGSVYRNLDTNVDKLNVAQSKQQEPEEWGTWQKQGSEIALTWQDGDTDTWEDKSWFVASKAAKGETIAGAYSSISGGGNTAFGGSVITFSSSNISFNGNKFTFESTGGGSSSDVTAYSSQEKAGTYELDGYSITLRFNNGAVEKKFFYFYPDSKDVFGIGDQYYVTD
ncbi:hypothetical protein [Adhaeribacter pallidiroseus]|uniref:Uncharacterized protein n=1 Tax=Adhaeribacter pallidiroseus TaxID=2072847 RepID=A0A369QHJ4_9BACT|nr:hypothetical protein [Adhaeribacter pallidiroseus]RDC64383.1 hypothetical protein AHMF7616_02996 [Adhaeribacter pallidiroseus]